MGDFFLLYKEPVQVLVGENKRKKERPATNRREVYVDLKSLYASAPTRRISESPTSVTVRQETR